LEAVLKFDRMLMEEVKGIVPVPGGGAPLDDLRLAGETTAVAIRGFEVKYSCGEFTVGGREVRVGDNVVGFCHRTACTG
jgi:hypothetical protein